MAAGEPSRREIVAALIEAASGRRWRGPGDAWTYGWCVESYRRSAVAAIAVRDGRVQLTPAAVKAYEAAIAGLLRMPAISIQWDPEEVWGEVAHLVATLPDSSRVELESLIAEGLSRILDSSDSFIAFAVANVDWSGDPIVLADSVIGRVDRGWIEVVDAAAAGRASLSAITSPPQWLARESDAVAFAAWVRTRGRRAVDDAETRFNDLVAAALVLCDDPGSRGLWSLRGDSHRPGVRGLRLHRSAFRRTTDGRIRDELAAQVLQATPSGTTLGHRWFGEDPFPLDTLLDASAQPFVDSIARGADAVHRRLRTAGRWHARFHWSSDSADAMLALGVALDALLAEPGGSPGRVLVERFALLEPDPTHRASAARLARRIYEARSSVAHGGASKDINDIEFVRSAAYAVRQTARRILDVSVSTQMASEKAFHDTFEALRWGTMSPNRA